MKFLRAMLGVMLLACWAHAAEAADRVASATYVPLPKPRKITERPPAQDDWCVHAITVLLDPHADVLVRTATLEKARNRGCVN